MSGGWFAGVLMALCALGATTQAASTDRTVITSRRVRVLDKGRRVEFTGDVRLNRGTDFLGADRLVTEEGRDVVRAWGQVVLRRDDPVDGMRWEARGDRADYSPEASSGTLWSDAGLVHARREAMAKTGDDRVAVPDFTLEAGVLRFQRSSTDPRADTAWAEGRVRLHQWEDGPPVRESVLWADAAHFDGASGRMRLTGAYGGPWTGTLGPVSLEVGARPYAQQREGTAWREMTGRTILYRSTTRRLAVDGDVQALVRFENTEVSSGGVAR